MKGTVRLNALFKDYVILPVKEYSHLKEVREGGREGVEGWGEGGSGGMWGE